VKRVAALPLLLLTACGPPTSGRPVEELYADHCARCHGDDGRGDPRQLPLAPALDLTRSTLIARRARGALYRRIQQGQDTMPAFGHKLPQGDIELLVDHVMRFQAR